MNTRHIARALTIGTLLLGARTALASCGAASCTLMSDRYTLDSGTGRSGLSIDLRYENIEQDRLRNGTSKATPADTAGEEALEQHTRQRALMAAFDYGLDTDWSLQLRVPLLQREHAHRLLDEDSGEPMDTERWSFDGIGDAQLLLRRRFTQENGSTVYALFTGFKLPSGSRHAENSEGVRAERALQAGSGTTDIMLGASARHTLGLHDAIFAQLGMAQALSQADGFEPGRRLSAGAGWSHALGPRVGTVLQLNLLHRERDAGTEAEPEVSGGITLDISPGLTWSPRPGSTVYAYLQFPLYSDVNGTQLAPSRTLAVGWSVDF